MPNVSRETLEYVRKTVGRECVRSIHAYFYIYFPMFHVKHSAMKEETDMAHVSNFHLLEGLLPPIVTVTDTTLERENRSACPGWLLATGLPGHIRSSFCTGITLS